MLINSRKKKNVVSLPDSFSLPFAIARAELALMEEPWEIIGKVELPTGTIFAMKNADKIRLLAKYRINVKVGQAPIWYADSPLSQDIDGILCNVEMRQHPVALTPGIRVIPEGEDITVFTVSEVTRRRGMWGFPQLYGNSTLRAFSGYAYRMHNAGITGPEHPLWEHPMSRIPKEAIMYTILEGYSINVKTERAEELQAVYNAILQPIEA